LFRYFRKLISFQNIKNDTGFTFLETLIALLMLLSILGIIALYFGVQTQLSTETISDLYIERQIQQLHLVLQDIEKKAKPAFWWRDQYWYLAGNELRIRDIGSLYAFQKDEKRDLLDLQWQEKDLSVLWEDKQFRFRFTAGFNIEVKKMASNPGILILFAIKSSRKITRLYLCLEAMNGF